MAVIEKLRLSVLPQNLYNQLPTAQCFRDDLRLKRFTFLYKQMLQLLFWSGVKISFAHFTTAPQAS